MVSWVRLKRKIVLNQRILAAMAMGGTAVAGVIIALSSTGKLPINMPFLGPQDKAVVQEVARDMKTLSDQKEAYDAAEELLKASNFAKLANESRANKDFGSAYEYFDEVIKHSSIALKEGIPIPKFIIGMKNQIQQTAQEDIELVKINVQHSLLNQNHEIVFKAIDEFEQRIKSMKEYINMGNYNSEIKLLRKEVVEHGVENGFKNANIFLSVANSPDGIPKVFEVVDQAIEFMGGHRSKALGVDVDKFKLEGNLIKGAAQVKLAGFHFKAFEDNREKNPEFAIQQLRLAKNVAVDAKNLGVNPHKVLRQINHELGLILR